MRGLVSGMFLIISAAVLMAFATRVESYHMPSFELGAAAGWLNQDDGRQFPLKGTMTINKFGQNQDSDTTEDSVSDVSDFGGPIRCFTVPGSTAAALYLSSDDENDGSDNDGISITVEYINGSYESKSVDVALGAASASGTVFVQIGSETIFWINRMYPTSTASSGNIYAGTASADDDTDGIPQTPLTMLVSVIDLTEQQTMSACYMVPADYDAFLYNFTVSNVDVPANADATFRLRQSVEFGAVRTVEPVHIAETITESIGHVLPIRFTEKTAIELTNTSSANDATVTGTFDLLLIKGGS